LRQTLARFAQFILAVNAFATCSSKSFVLLMRSVTIVEYLLSRGQLAMFALFRDAGKIGAELATKPIEELRANVEAGQKDLNIVDEALSSSSMSEARAIFRVAVVGARDLVTDRFTLAHLSRAILKSELEGR
jgi:hypothetical protein